MKSKIKLVALTILLCMANATIKAQGLVDGFFNKKGEGNISLSYSYSSYDKFYVAEVEMDGVPAHNEISQNIYNLYANYGITDRLTAIINLPYISTKGKGDPDPVNGTTEQSEIQDLSMVLKYDLHTKGFNNGNIKFFTALGGSIPFGYEPNGILSIGNGAATIDTKLGTHYKNNSGFFGTLALGYTFRGKADNNLGVGDGSDFDAPNSFNSLIKLGYSSAAIYLDAWFDSQTTTGDAVDIGASEFFGNFPETKVNYSRIGANVFVPIIENFGANAGVGVLVDGRNIGKSTTITLGVVYGFGR